MRGTTFLRLSFLSCAILFLSACTTHSNLSGINSVNDPDDFPVSKHFDESRFANAMPRHIDTDQKIIIVDPKVYAWGAYDANGDFVKGGIATAGANYCYDDKAPCRTDAGTFHIYAMKGEDCKSHIYPKGKGGALMPYCMFFNKGQSFHGSPDMMLVAGNISHGCVHIRIPDAEWLEEDFARIGTKVVIEEY